MPSHGWLPVADPLFYLALATSVLQTAAPPPAMNVKRWMPRPFGSRSRPVATPTSLSLLLTVSLMFGAMLLPDRSDQRTASAAQTQAPLVRVTPAAPQRAVSLRDRLIVGLRALRPSEVSYVDNVVNKVQTGQLPQRLVDEAFFWSRRWAVDRRRGRVHRPIIYFQPVLTARAERIGVEL